ncbi:hypothetical protein FRC01_010140 [Tulasnella sp. 417]|nr:hypothetical protein FRC01_010140 [Tulasnella sp. 417]
MAGILHYSLHGEGIDEYYVKYDYRVGLILKGLGMYERAEYHPQKSEVTQLALAEVKAKMEALENQYRGRRRSREELDGRRKTDGSFLLNDEEIEMLFAAGVMPWDYGIARQHFQDILVAGRDSGEGEEDISYDTEEDREREGSMKGLIEQFEKDHQENGPDGSPDLLQQRVSKEALARSQTAMRPQRTEQRPVLGLGIPIPPAAVMDISTPTDLHT